MPVDCTVDNYPFLIADMLMCRLAAADAADAADIRRTEAVNRMFKTPSVDCGVRAIGRSSYAHGQSCVKPTEKQILPE